MNGDDDTIKKILTRDEVRLPTYFFLKHLILNGVTALSYWITWNLYKVAESVIAQTILKYVFYVSIVLWLNSLFALYSAAKGEDVDSFEFQIEQVKLSLWIVGLMILMELPIWLDSLSI